MKRVRQKGRAGLFALGLLPGLAALGAFAGNAGAASTVHHRGCRSLKVNGMSVRAARAKAAKASCFVRLDGAPVHTASRQQVAVDSGSARSLTLWVFPEGCEWLPSEPLYTSGPTQLVSALHVVGGGAPRLHQQPHPECGRNWAGTVIVLNEAGEQAASEHVVSGELARISLSPGRYTVEGVYDTATVNGQPAHSLLEHVTVLAGKTVRQDVTYGFP
jgi:hypothetical protein